MYGLGKLAYAVAFNIMEAIAEYTPAELATIGVPEEDAKLTFNGAVWHVDHRRRVENTLDALVFGTLDVMGLDRIRIPAEMIAAVVATFVGPGNRATACRWLASRKSTGAPVQEMIARGVEAHTADHVSADQLFALVLALSDTEQSSLARASYAQRLHIAGTDLNA